METRTASNHPSERKDDQHPLGPLNWEENPTPEQMREDAANLDAFRLRVQQGAHGMLEQIIKTTGADPMRVVMTQKFDLDGSITMTAKILPEPEMHPRLASLCGRLVEVGNLDGDPDIGIVLDLGDSECVTLLGLRHQDARAIAQHYGDQIEVTVRAVPATGQKNG